MNIYIFLPYSWSHCGGMCAVIAEDIRIAIDLLHTHFLKEDEEYNGVITTDHHDSRLMKDHWDQWLLSYAYPIGATEREVIVNYNHA